MDRVIRRGPVFVACEAAEVEGTGDVTSGGCPVTASSSFWVETDRVNLLGPGSS